MPPEGLQLSRTGWRLQGFQGVLDRAQEVLAATEGAVMLGQFENPANPEVHRRTTGPEIWRDTAGQVHPPTHAS